MRNRLVIDGSFCRWSDIEQYFTVRKHCRVPLKMWLCHKANYCQLLLSLETVFWGWYEACDIWIMSFQSLNWGMDHVIYNSATKGATQMRWMRNLTYPGRCDVSVIANYLAALDSLFVLIINTNLVTKHHYRNLWLTRSSWSFDVWSKS